MRGLLRHPLSAVLLLFVVTRGLAHGAGLAFDDQTFLAFWHAIDLPLLQTRLWESLLHLHTQPPLFNAFVGAVHQLAPAHSGAVFHAAFAALGLAHAVVVYALGRALGWGRGLSAVGAGLVVLTPTALLYELFLFFTLEKSVLLSASGLALVVALRRSDGRGWLLFFLVVASLVGLRSLFHGLWLIAAIVFGLLLSPGRRAVARGALAPLLLVGLLYAKNAAMFGTPSTSSWLGMSLARMSTDRMAEAPREAMIEAGVLHPIARVRPYQHLSAYEGLVDTGALTGVPLLDETDKQNGTINFHHRAYLEVSALYTANFVSVLRAEPALYWRRVRRARARFWSAAWRYPPLEPNAQRLAPRLVPASSALLKVLAGLGVAGAALPPWGRERSALRLWLAGLVVYVWLVGTLLEVGENYRFRYLVAAPMVVLGLDALRRVWVRYGAPHE